MGGRAPCVVFTQQRSRTVVLSWAARGPADGEAISQARHRSSSVPRRPHYVATSVRGPMAGAARGKSFVNGFARKASRALQLL
ncbi:MAG: hypothetical protein D6744_18660 [Planctomycetota bacterium]|nr:MAG: hypothetical protein D6744_18660 [Planctomycetota bacterium]